MSELTLKDESVIEIGKAVGNNVDSLTGGSSTALVPAGGGGMVAPAVEAMPMNPFDSMMVVLSDIRDGIYTLVDKFSDSVSIQKDQIQDQAMAQDLAQVGGGGGEDEAPTIDDGGGDDRSFMDKAKDKIGGLMGAGGLKGMLIKGGLIAGLLGIAKLMQKYGKEIAEKVAPIVDGVKAFFSAFTDDIGPIFDSAVETIKTALTGIVDLVKGLFTGDASTFFGGVKTLFIDFPIQLVSYIGDAFFSLLENALAAFGIESEMVTDIKNFFRELPEKISELFTNIGLFFTETIPAKLQAIKDSITNFFNDNIVTPIKNLWTDIGNFFTVTVPEKFTEITTGVTSFFTNVVSSITGFFTDGFNFVTQTIPEKLGEITSGIAQKFVEIKDQIIDFALAPFRKIRELFDNLLIGILESVEGIPFIGGKAKEMKENILADRAEQTAQIDKKALMKEREAEFFELVDKNKDGIKKFSEATGYQFDLSGTKYLMSQGTKMFSFDKGDKSFLAPADGFNAENQIEFLKGSETIRANEPVTGGATGEELNTESQMLAASGANGGGGGVVVGGSTQVNNSSSVQHNAADENSGVSDKTVGDNLYD